MRIPCLIFGSCFILLLAFNDAAQANASSAKAQGAFAKVFGKSNAVAKDQGKKSREVSPQLLFYIHRKTSELLPDAWRGQSAMIATALVETAKRFDMDPIFIMSVALSESRFNPEVVGGHGEIGLMQVKPSTALWLLEQNEVGHFGISPDQASIAKALKDPVANIAFGTAYLSLLKRAFHGRQNLYLTAYNMGAVNLKNHLRKGYVPRRYNDRVMANLTSFRRQFAQEQRVAIRNVASISSTFGLK